MKVSIHRRLPGQIPWGALVMLPLFAMPIGGWLVEQGWVDFGVCAMKSGLGIPCLTCGATRATLHLLHGEIGAAIAMQPLTIALYSALAVWGLSSLSLFAANRYAQIRLSRVEDRAFKGALIVLPLLNWAYLIAAGV
jgi:hypothetical protein